MKIKNTLCLISILLFMAGCKKIDDFLFIKNTYLKCTINGIDYKSPMNMIPLQPTPHILSSQSNDSIYLSVYSQCLPVDTTKGNQSYGLSLVIWENTPLVIGKRYEIIAPLDDNRPHNSHARLSWEELKEEVGNLIIYDVKELYTSGYIEIIELNNETNQVKGKFVLETANNTEQTKNERKLKTSGEFQGIIREIV